MLTFYLISLEITVTSNFMKKYNHALKPWHREVNLNLKVNPMLNGFPIQEIRQMEANNTKENNFYNVATIRNWRIQKIDY
jgi:hypothetical protein